jgi:hypothetical protein
MSVMANYPSLLACSVVRRIGVQISDWTPVTAGSNLLTRNLSYIKPLNGSVGPKQTKCEIKDETVFSNFDDHVTMITTTRTPDVPSGGVFSVKTRTCITWATGVSSKVVVTTQVEWTGRSFIKGGSSLSFFRVNQTRLMCDCVSFFVGIIERSCIDGQKTYHADLEKAMRAYISAHSSEFIPEGLDPNLVTAPSPDGAPSDPSGNPPKSPTESTKDALTLSREREKERNQRAFQWAYDTFDGARSVAIKSTKGALELVKDAWDQNSTTTVLIFFIVGLCLSNLYTWLFLSGVPSGVKREMERLKRVEREALAAGLGGMEKEKWVRGVVEAVIDEVGGSKKDDAVASVVAAVGAGASAGASSEESPKTQLSAKEEMELVLKMIHDAEQRLEKIRDVMKAANGVTAGAGAGAGKLADVD